MVAERVIPTLSASWKASFPMRCVGTWPVKATSGIESISASWSAVTRLVAAGPEVTRQTPIRPVVREYPSAACPAAASWRTRTWRMPSKSYRTS